MKKRRTMPIILGLLSILAFSGSYHAYAGDIEDQITKSFKVSKGQTLYLKSDLGSVAVQSWDRDEVTITVIKKADANSKRRAEEIFEDLELSFDQTMDGVKIIAEYHGARSWWGERRLQLHFDITVPKQFNLDVRTAGGSINVMDLIGKADLNTSGGSIKAGQIDGAVIAKTSGGTIKVAKARGDVTASTSGGSISIDEAFGSVVARTSGGSISMDEITGDAEAHTSGGGLTLKNINGNLNGSTSGGSIHAEIIGKIDRSCSLKTSGGSIRLYLPHNISADIDASTSGGHVSTDFPITVRGVIKSSSLQGKINQGGPLIMLRTSGGSIFINELTGSNP
ncbi:MAG: DUF4097 domain-containing protein [candidate division KSB1 bacterium]|nr:DUF4097 domain-containing protein [candidate division KSB1 bacterium]MDZ7341667.1 DUF4097 domain-containing protein [candidate division KSB1 bacterium]